jgi:hypothetical protein
MLSYAYLTSIFAIKKMHDKGKKKKGKRGIKDIKTKVAKITTKHILAISGSWNN